MNGSPVIKGQVNRPPVFEVEYRSLYSTVDPTTIYQYKSTFLFSELFNEFFMMPGLPEMTLLTYFTTYIFAGKLTPKKNK